MKVVECMFKLSKYMNDELMGFVDITNQIGDFQVHKKVSELYAHSMKCIMVCAILALANMMDPSVACMQTNWISLLRTLI